MTSEEYKNIRQLQDSDLARLLADEEERHALRKELIWRNYSKIKAELIDIYDKENVKK